MHPRRCALCGHALYPPTPLRLLHTNAAVLPLPLPLLRRLPLPGVPTLPRVPSSAAAVDPAPRPLPLQHGPTPASLCQCWPPCTAVLRRPPQRHRHAPCRHGARAVGPHRRPLPRGAAWATPKPVPRGTRARTASGPRRRPVTSARRCRTAAGAAAAARRRRGRRRRARQPGRGRHGVRTPGRVRHIPGHRSGAGELVPSPRFRRRLRL